MLLIEIFRTTVLLRLRRRPWLSRSRLHHPRRPQLQVVKSLCSILNQSKKCCNLCRLSRHTVCSCDSGVIGSGGGSALDAAADGEPGGARSARRCDHAHEEHRADRAGQAPDQAVVLFPVPAGAGLSVLHLHLRVLPAVRAEQEVPVKALG